jgi:two-component system, NtrC family, sensor kinase
MSVILDGEAADLRCKLDERRAERDAALAREAALADVLDGISRSTADVQPVLDTVVDTTAHLCGPRVDPLAPLAGRESG